jgi:Fe-S-cluster containining protein
VNDIIPKSETVKRIDASPEQSRLRAIRDEGEHLANRARPNQPNVYLKIRELADEASRLVAPYVPCRKGCAHCCYMAVLTTGYEAKLIGRYTGRKPVNMGPWKPGGGDRMRERFTGVPCTFLDVEKGECTIYPVRPIECRTHIVAEDSSKPCEFYEGAAYANYVNLQSLKFASGYLFAKRYGIADIREFFPKEEGK